MFHALTSAGRLHGPWAAHACMVVQGKYRMMHCLVGQARHQREAYGFTTKHQGQRTVQCSFKTRPHWRQTRSRQKVEL